PKPETTSNETETQDDHPSDRPNVAPRRLMRRSRMESPPDQSSKQNHYDHGRSVTVLLPLGHCASDHRAAPAIGYFVEPSGRLEFQLTHLHVTAAKGRSLDLLSTC